MANNHAKLIVIRVLKSPNTGNLLIQIGNTHVSLCKEVHESLYKLIDETRGQYSPPQ